MNRNGTLHHWPHVARALARQLHDALLLRGWPAKKAERFAKAKERRLMKPRH